MLCDPATGRRNVRARAVLGAATWLLSTALAAALTGCAATEETKTTSVKAAAPHGMYAFWPKYPDEPRIQFVRSISVSTDLAPSQASGLEKLVFGKENINDAAAIYKPYGVDSKGGRIYVCDIRNSCLTVFDIPKKQTRLVGVSGINRLTHPVDVAVADDGMLYVADNEQGSVFVFDASERYVRPIGKSKCKPVSVAVHGDKLYVCDMTAQVVDVFNRKTGEQTGTIGTVGDGDGQFRLPLSVDVDKDGNVYVVDMMRCRIQKFGPDGAYLSGLGQMGDYAGAFVRPKHIAVDNSGILYVVDAAFQNVQMFDDKSQLLMHFGAAGGFPGSMDMPVGICVTDEGVELFKDEIHPGFEPKRLVIVTNQFGPSKVAIYVMGERRSSFPLADLSSSMVDIPTGATAETGPRDLQMSADDESTLGAEPGTQGEGEEKGGEGAEDASSKESKPK